jgi:Tfp pilus assembly protein PilO
MTTTTRYTLIAALVAVAVFAAGWFALIGPKRDEAEQFKADTAAAQQQNAQLQSKIKQLEAQAADLPAQQARLAEIRTQIPDTPALPSLVRSLTAIGKTAGVDVRSLTPGDVEAVVIAAPTTSSNSTSTTGTESGTESSGTTATTDSTTETGLVAIPIDIQVFGSYFDIEQFINEAEDLTRAMLITGISITPLGDSAETPGDLDATITARVYMTQAQADAAAAATGTQAG